MAESAVGPLSGVRVLDLTSGLAGPLATRLLADAGADVVKVESARGDAARRLQPVAYATWNRGKSRVVIDRDTAQGGTALDRLCASADVVVHDLTATAAVAAGLTADAMADRYPAVVVVAVPPFPEGHPEADTDASDAMVQALTGFMDEQQGNRPGPVYVRMPFPSLNAAYLAAIGAVARLLQRQRTGSVAGVATSLFQGALAPAALYWQRWDRLPRTLTRHTLPKIWPDAALSIFQCEDDRWVQLAGAVGGWIESPPVLEALAVRDLVDLSEVGVTPTNWKIWNEVFRSRSSRWWETEFARCDVPCMVLRELGECFEEEQAVLNGYVVETADDDLGRLVQAGPPVRLSSSPPKTTGRGIVSVGLDAVLARWEPGVRPVVAGATSASASRPLEGMRVLDFGSMVAGPFGAQCLADLGADVIKVEPPSGDRGRQLTQFAGCHRHKRSLAIDLKQDAVRPALRRLVESADVVLHNMRLAPAARLGLDGAGLRAVNPRVVFSHISAYGSSGPMADYPGYDPTAQAITGWEHANAGEDGKPIWLRNSIFDIQAGFAAALGAVLGLYEREIEGTAPEASTSLLAVGITASSEVALDPATCRPTDWPRLDRAQTGLDDFHRIRATRDGWILVDTRDAVEEAALRRWMHTEPSADDPFASEDTQELCVQLQRAGVRAAPVRLDQLDAWMDDQTHHRMGFVRRFSTVDFGQIDLVGGFWSCSRPSIDGESVPTLGQHTVALLAELGTAPDVLAHLLEQRTATAFDESRLAPS